MLPITLSTYFFGLLNTHFSFCHCSQWSYLLMESTHLIWLCLRSRSGAILSRSDVALNFIFRHVLHQGIVVDLLFQFSGGRNKINHMMIYFPLLQVSTAPWNSWTNQRYHGSKPNTQQAIRNGRAVIDLLWRLTAYAADLKPLVEISAGSKLELASSLRTYSETILSFSC